MNKQHVAAAVVIHSPAKNNHKVDVRMPRQSPSSPIIVCEKLVRIAALAALCSIPDIVCEKRGPRERRSFSLFPDDLWLLLSTRVSAEQI